MTISEKITSDINLNTKEPLNTDLINAFNSGIIKLKS